MAYRINDGCVDAVLVQVCPVGAIIEDGGVFKIDEAACIEWCLCCSAQLSD